MPDGIFPGGSLWEKVLNALLITQCGICSNPQDTHGICDTCSAALEFAESKQPIFELSADGVNIRCATCFIYDGDTVTKLLFSLKKNGSGPIVNFAAARLKGAVSLLSPLGNVIFTNVPRSTSGKMKYGFDQSELLAKRAARMYGAKYIKFIKRVGVSREQKSLNAEQRQINLRGKLRVGNRFSSIQPDSIVIFDDVMTTGSSIKECARLLHNKYPGASLYAVTLATRQPTDKFF